MVITATTPTVLTMVGIGVPPYSARGLTQTLEPISQAQSIRRTVNGVLVDLSQPQFRKYKSTISGNDVSPPAVDGIWPGQLVTVECIAELSYPTGGTADRPVVDYSTRVEGDFTVYRPELEMMVTAFQQTTDEWGASTKWTMDLEEVGA